MSIRYSVQRVNDLIQQLGESGSNFNGSPRVTSASLIRALAVLRDQIEWEQREADRRVARAAQISSGDHHDQ